MFSFTRLVRVLLLSVALLESGCLCWRHHRCCYEHEPSPAKAPQAVANHGP